MKSKVLVKIGNFKGRFTNVTVNYSGESNTYFVNGGDNSEKQLSPSQLEMKNVCAFVKRLEVSESFKNDCRIYVNRRSTDAHEPNLVFVNWMSLLIKTVRAQMRSTPEIDLLSFTKNQVLELDLPFCSIYASINAGFLGNVRDKYKLKNHI